MTKRSLVLSTAVLLLAAVFRLWQIAELPPALHSDEAFHLLYSQTIATGQSFPAYLTGNNGNEPLFAYLSAITLLILGPVTWVGRLTAAWVGVIGVAATIRLGDEMFPRRGVGWLAGAALATLWWNVIFSRFGSQPILAATAAAACMAALWRGARTGSRWAFALAGVALGLGLDGYVAFRLFSLVPLAGGLALVLSQPARRRALLAGAAIAGASTLLVYSPLAVFFAQNPEWFLTRYGETTVLNSGRAGLKLLADNGLKTLGMLVLRGDQEWRHNLPGRPALDAVQAYFGAVGAVVLAGRWRQPEALAITAWLVVGLSPSVVTNPSPHFGRTTMVTPALALLVGLGLSAAWRLAQGWRPWQALIVLASVLSVALTANTYFGVWAHSGALWASFETEELDFGRALQAAPQNARLIEPYAPHNPYTTEYVTGRPVFGGVEAYNADHCLLLPTPATEPAALGLYLHAGRPLLLDLQRAYPTGTWRVSPALKDSQPYLGVFQIPVGQQPLTTVAVTRSADFAGLVRLQGYDLSPAAPHPSDTLSLHTLWQIEDISPTAYKLFAHLLGAPKADGSTVYAQHDGEPCDDSYATTSWTVGDLLAADLTLALPADLAPGAYTVQIGWYDSASGTRATVSGDEGPHANDAVQLQQVVVAQP